MVFLLVVFWSPLGGLVVFLLVSSRGVPLGLLSWSPLGLPLVFTLCIPSKIKTGAKLKNALLRIVSIRTPSANKDQHPQNDPCFTSLNTWSVLPILRYLGSFSGRWWRWSQNGDLMAPMGVFLARSTTYTLSDFFTKFLRTP